MKFRMLSIAALAITLGVVFYQVNTTFASEKNTLVYATIEIDNVGHQSLLSLQATTGFEWWVELDEQLLVLTTAKVLSDLKGYEYKVLPISVNQEQLYFIRRAHDNDIKQLAADVLAQGGRFAVIQARGALHIEHHHSAPGDDPSRMAEVHAALQPFVANSILARQVGNNEVARISTFSANVDKIVDYVDGSRWFADVEKLASYNRYTHGDGVLSARDWLVKQYQQLPGMEVTTTSFDVGFSTAYNVVAKLEGTTRPDEWYIVGAHYDSISENTGHAAPGAEDNASGAAGVLEMARVFSKYRPQATILFISFSGEEQGLYGSYHHVQQLFDNGKNGNVRAVLNMDMIGFTRDSDLDCLLETGTVGKHLLDTYSQAARQFTSLRIVTSLNPFGSDHVPYIQRGIPAVLTIENDWNQYPNYHRTTDLPSKVSVEMGTQVLRMNVAFIAQTAKASE